MTGERRIASDTGPLITLEKLSNGYRFIRLLYDKILIPRVVLEELIQGQFLDSRAYLEHYGIADLLQVVGGTADLLRIDATSARPGSDASSESSSLTAVLNSRSGRLILSRAFRAAPYNQRYNLASGGDAMTTLKLTTVGNSTGVVLPKEILQRLRVERGDTLYVLETPNGIELTPYSPELAAQMEAAERVMREDRDVLRKLAE